MMQNSGSPKGCAKGSRKGLTKGSRNPGLNNSNATAPRNATTTHLNATQLQQHLKPRRGLEESKTYSVISRYSNGPIGNEVGGLK